MRNKIFFFILALIIINFLLNFKSLNYSFVEDDFVLIVYNNRVKNINLLINSIETPFFRSIEHPYLHYWRPVVLFSYYIDYQLWGLNPKGFHLTNIIIHTLNTILIFYLLLLLTKNNLFSFIVSFIFSILPSHAESVSWISGRTDLLATMFLLFTTLFICFSLKKVKYKILFFIISVLIFPLAVLSKEIAFVFPMVLFFVVLLIKRFKDSLMISIPYGIISIIFFFIHIKYSNAQSLLKDIKFSNIKIILKTAGIYCKLLFSLFVKAPLYSMKTFDKENFYPFIFLLVFSVLIFLIVKNRETFKVSYYSIPILLFLIPVVNPKIISSYPPITLRFIYTTSIFSAIFIAEFILSFLKKKIFTIIIIFSITLFMAYILQYLYFQRFYENNFTRAKKLTKIFPEEGIYKIQLSLLYAQRKRYKKALILTENAIKENKNNPWVDIKTKGSIFKANLLILTGEKDKAKEILIKLIKDETKPYTRYNCYITLSKLYEKNKDYKKALYYLEKGEFLFKTSDLYFRKAVIFYYFKKYRKALISLEKAKKMNPELKYYLTLKNFILLKNKKD